MKHSSRKESVNSPGDGVVRAGALRPTLIAAVKRYTTVRKVRVACAAALMALGPAMAAPPAFAADGGIYAVTPDWGGWKCPGVYNNLAFVYFANHTMGKNGGDGGDDIVWMPVRLGQNNSVTMSAKCTFSTFAAVNYVIKPTRNKQTFWFRANGTFKNN